MIQNLIFVILFLKISFPHVPVDIISFFIPEFVAENLKANKNQRKRSLILQYSFAQKTSLILRISTLLKLKIIFSQNTVKRSYQFTNFPTNMFLFRARKSISPLHLFLTPKNYFLESKYLYILYTSLRHFCFKDSRFYLVV